MARAVDSKALHCLAQDVSEATLTFPWAIIYGPKLTAVVFFPSTEEISPCAKM